MYLTQRCENGFIPGAAVDTVRTRGVGTPVLGRWLILLIQNHRHSRSYVRSPPSCAGWSRGGRCRIPRYVGPVVVPVSAINCRLIDPGDNTRSACNRTRAAKELAVHRGMAGEGAGRSLLGLSMPAQDTFPGIQ